MSNRSDRALRRAQKVRNQRILIIVLVVALLAVVGYFIYQSLNKPQVEAPTTLQIEDIKKGSGPEVKAGDTITVHYTGTLLDGTKFDSSLDRNQPFTFVIGNGDVIAGWDQGLVGMQVGGQRQLTIPPELAYGDQSVGGVIPANSTLVFVVDLLEIK
jgi:FKBP-type peptidyl-prolyl cis-trans isomerase